MQEWYQLHCLNKQSLVVRTEETGLDSSLFGKWGGDESTTTAKPAQGSGEGGSSSGANESQNGEKSSGGHANAENQSSNSAPGQPSAHGEADRMSEKVLAVNVSEAHQPGANTSFNARGKNDSPHSSTLSRESNASHRNSEQDGSDGSHTGKDRISEHHGTVNDSIHRSSEHGGDHSHSTQHQYSEHHGTDNHSTHRSSGHVDDHSHSTQHQYSKHLVLTMPLCIVALSMVANVLMVRKTSTPSVMVPTTLPHIAALAALSMVASLVASLIAPSISTLTITVPAVTLRSTNLSIAQSTIPSMMQQPAAGKPSNTEEVRLGCVTTHSIVA